MTDDGKQKQRKRKRIFLSTLLTLVTDDKILAMAFSPIRTVTTVYDQHMRSKMFSISQNHRAHILFRPRGQRRFIRMNDLMSEDLIGEDRPGNAAKYMHDTGMIRSKLASWSTQQLLIAMNERGIRYPPTSSRTDLENSFVEFVINYYDSDTFDANNSGSENIISDLKSLNRASSNDVYSFPEKRVSTSKPQDALEDRLQKRLQRKSHQQTRPDRVRKSISNIMYTVAPSMSDNVLDFTKRKARRLKRQIADFMLLDEETGIRDVVRFDYVRREQSSTAHALKREVILGPGDAIEVISNDTPTQHLTSDAKSSVSSNDASSSDNVHSTSTVRHSASSPILRELYESNSSSNFRLPPGSHDNVASFSSLKDTTPTKRKSRNQYTNDKKVYNPYGRDGRDIINDDKDAIDRVADFFTKTADDFFDLILDNDINLNSNNYDNSPSTTGATNVQIPFDSPTTTPRSSQQRRNNNNFNKNKKNRTPRKHWKDRLEERLDSMLGLHESGDFYRSWTEHNEHENDDGADEPFDAFSTAKGRKPSKRKGKSLHYKPFWEEDGNIFSLLLGRTQHYTPPHWDLRLGFRTGSLLSIFWFALQNFLIVASYICRWASTQGALPQPVVVLGVGSAILCARPHQRLFSAGIALLILRTVGEVLHGYVYGNSGWEDDSYYDETTTGAGETADTEQNDEIF